MARAALQKIMLRRMLGNAPPVRGSQRLRNIIGCATNYRQSRIYARDGVELSTLAGRVGKATALLEPYWGGQRRGGKRGRGALGKTPFVAAVELNEEAEAVAESRTTPGSLNGSRCLPPGTWPSPRCSAAASLAAIRERPLLD